MESLRLPPLLHVCLLGWWLKRASSNQKCQKEAMKENDAQKEWPGLDRFASKAPSRVAFASTSSSNPRGDTANRKGGSSPARLQLQGGGFNEK